MSSVTEVGMDGASAEVHQSRRHRLEPIAKNSSLRQRRPNMFVPTVLPSLPFSASVLPRQ
jgi:hypothetical protein